jgi:hypothetical protein
MKKFLIIMMIAMGCTKEESAMPTIGLGNKIEASYDTEVAYSEGIKIKITKIEDSRCPKSVTCVWQGSARIYLTVSGMEVSKDLVLDFLADNSKPANANFELGSQKYFIEIADVLPYPATTDEIKLKDYKISLTVKKI